MNKIAFGEFKLAPTLKFEKCDSPQDSVESVLRVSIFVL